MTTNPEAGIAVRDAASDAEIGDDLTITKTTRRAGGAGTWVIGTLIGRRISSGGIDPGLPLGCAPRPEGRCRRAFSLRSS
jgi:hypothetical protein